MHGLTVSSSQEENAMRSSPSNLLTRGSQLSGAHSLAADSRRGSQSSGARSLAGMTKTIMCVSHVTDRAICGGQKTSTCVFQLTDLEFICRGLPSGPEARRQERGELDAVLVSLLLFGLRGLDGIWRHDVMLGGVVDDCKIRGRSRLAFVPRCPVGRPVQGDSKDYVSEPVGDFFVPREGSRLLSSSKQGSRLLSSSKLANLLLEPWEATHKYFINQRIQIQSGGIKFEGGVPVQVVK